MLDCALKIKTSNSRGKANRWVFSFWWSDGITNVSTGAFAHWNGGYLVIKQARLSQIRNGNWYHSHADAELVLG